MKKIIMRVMAFMLALITLTAGTRLDVSAFNAGEGSVCEAFESGYYIGSDGLYYGYPMTGPNASHFEYVVFDENGDGTYWTVDYPVDNTTTEGARAKWYLKDTNGIIKQVYCIEAGVPFGDGESYGASASEYNNFFLNLPDAAQDGIRQTLVYGWTEGKESPVPGTNADDYAFATQIIIWEYQQQLRTNPTERQSNQWGVPADMLYLSLKDRPAEQCYNWILNKIANHDKIPSFASDIRNNAPVYTLKYNAETRKYSLTLTDTNNTGYPIKTDASSGYTVKQDGNKYTFEMSGRNSTSTTISYKKEINDDELPMLVWHCDGKQTVCTGVEDPVQFYMSLKTEGNGDLKIVKTSETGQVSGISFEISGNGITETVVTGSDGSVTTSLIPGTYTVKELNVENSFVTPEVQTITVTEGATATVNFANVLKKGNLVVTKSSEDGIITGITFRLHGTSASGSSVNLTATTDAAGKAAFNNVLIGTYTLEEVSTPDRYVTPAKQTVTITEGATASVSVNNVLKKGNLVVTKSSEDGIITGITFRLHGTSASGSSVNLTATTDAAGKAAFNNVLIGTYTLEEVSTPDRYVTPANQTVTITEGATASVSVNNVLKKFNVTIKKSDSEGPEIQGNGTLAGAVYGLYKDGVLVEELTTDAAGKATSGYHVCGAGYILKEIAAPEGYMLDTTEYRVGAEASNFTIQSNTLNIDLTDDVIKGNIAIIKHCDDGSTQIERPEAGAKFQIYLKAAGSYDAAEDSERDILICDEDGFAISKKLPYGTYTVHQIYGWDGRDLMSDFDVEIMKNDKVYKFLINNAVFTSYIKIVKTDAETGKVIPYAGAGFRLYDVNGITVTMNTIYPKPETHEVFYTNDEGYLITPEPLEYGEGYSLVEVKAPEGYVLDSTPVYFNVTVEDSVKQDGINIVTVSKDDVPQKGIINVVKTGHVLSQIKFDNGIYTPVYEIKPLSGAKYEIIAAEDIVTGDGTVRLKKGERADLVVTDSEGPVASIPLYLGKYTVKEVEAPYGYLISDEVYHTELTYTGEDVLVTDSSVTAYNLKQKVTVSLVKTMENFTDEISGEVIKDVTFGIYAAEDIEALDGSKILKDGLMEIMTVNVDGSAESVKDYPFGRYYVKELTTNDAYIIDDTEYGFEFSYMGEDIETVNIVINDGSAVHNQLKRGNVKVIKTSEDGIVSGITFRLTGTSLSGEEIEMTAITDENGIAIFENVLISGTEPYIITEVETAEKYVVPAEQEIIVEHGNTAEVEFMNTLKRGSVKVTKVSEDGNVKGIKFRLTGTSLSGEEIEMTAITDENGIAIFEDVLISGAELYVISEIEVADIYVIPDEQLIKVVAEDVTEVTVVNHIRTPDVPAGAKTVFGWILIGGVALAVIVVNVMYNIKKRR